MTPRLQRVVFSEDLLSSKVPILKKRSPEETTKPAVSGPVFLNADQFAERYPERAEELLKQQQHGEQREEEDTDETTDCTKSDTTKSDSSASATTADTEDHKEPDGEWVDTACLSTPQKAEGTSWAARLFGSTESADKKMKSERAKLSQREQKEEMNHQMKIESVLPIQGDANRIMMGCHSSSTSDESGASHLSKGSVEAVLSPTAWSPKSRMRSPKSMTGSPKSCKSSTSSLQIVVPSQGATDWRQKQISYGKNTVGYKNFAKKFPNKDLRFRHMHDLVSTPDAKEKIGKKRWVGKYQKWRKFLHTFDATDSSGEDTSD